MRFAWACLDLEKGIDALIEFGKKELVLTALILNSVLFYCTPVLPLLLPSEKARSLRFRSPPNEKGGLFEERV